MKTFYAFACVVLLAYGFCSFKAFTSGGGQITAADFVANSAVLGENITIAQAAAAAAHPGWKLRMAVFLSNDSAGNIYGAAVSVFFVLVVIYLYLTFKNQNV